jgi:hypothetical protein
MIIQAYGWYVATLSAHGGGTTRYNGSDSFGGLCIQDSTSTTTFTGTLNIAEPSAGIGVVMS